MNKRECVEWMLKKIREMEESRPKPNELESTVHSLYEECKKECRMSGYEGECFAQLWNKAVDLRAVEKGLPIK